MADDAVKRESEQKKSQFEQTLEQLQQEMEQAMAEWLSKAEGEMPVEDLVAMEKELAVYMKEWHLGKALPGSAGHQAGNEEPPRLHRRLQERNEEAREAGLKGNSEELQQESQA